MNEPLILVVVFVVSYLFLKWLEKYEERYKNTGSYWCGVEYAGLAPAERNRRIAKDRVGMMTPTQVQILGKITSLICLVSIIWLIVLGMLFLFSP